LRGRKGRNRVRRHVKVEVRVAAEYIDCRKVLGGSDAEKKESCQSELDKFFHVPYCASRECKKCPQPTESRLHWNDVPSYSGLGGLSSVNTWTRLRGLVIIIATWKKGKCKELPTRSL